MCPYGECSDEKGDASMTNPLITTDEVRRGELLAHLEDAEYRAVTVVYKLNGSDAATFYCSAQDWQQTEAGRTAALHAEITRLKEKLIDLDAAYLQRIEELHARIAYLQATPITVEEAVRPTTTMPTTDYPYCPECNDGPFNTRKGWKAHLRMKHGVR
jgi:uncharacterized small protein (DUF1192 family)